MLLVGLTGNYGMGKSTVLSLFEKCGAVVIDTDEIVESLLKEKDVLERIRGLLGESVFLEDGSLDKKKVAAAAFSNDGLRHSLEQILHPLVFERVHVLLEGIRDKSKVVLVEVPLLFEGGYESQFAKTITVYTREESALARLERHGVPRQEALCRLRSQLPIGEKIRRSDSSIDNNGTVEATMSQVENICRELSKEAKKGWK